MSVATLGVLSKPRLTCRVQRMPTPFSTNKTYCRETSRVLSCDDVVVQRAGAGLGLADRTRRGVDATGCCCTGDSAAEQLAAVRVMAIAQ